MANPEHLRILKQGVENWNKWRIINKDLRPYLEEADLVGADLMEADLVGADLRRANLGGADLERADLREAYLSEANLMEANLMAANLMAANLREANLMAADLMGANLLAADLRRADFDGANLGGADLERADFTGANLGGAVLRDANLMEANLKDTILIGAIFYKTTLANLVLDNVIGLEKISHRGPSHISTDTLQRAQGKLPEVFLRGCGLSDFEIENAKLFNPALNNQEINDIVYKIYDLRAQQTLQISPLFISYSHIDSDFVDKIETYINQKGVRSWRDVHHATAGPLEKQIDRAIRLNPTVLLILSENSIKSDWVEHEVRTARELTKELGRHVLCPIALDDSWECCSPWPKRIMAQVKEYNIVDFSKWEDKSEFEKQFRKLLDGLDLFYK